MKSQRRVGPWWKCLAVVVWTACLLPPPADAADAALPAKVESLRRQAAQLESQGQWARACEVYEQILTRDRTLADVRGHYLVCLRHAERLRRHQDPTYRNQAATLPFARALDVYGEVLSKLQNSYVERDKADVALLFRQGLEELRQALDDPAFCREQLPAAPPEAVHAFQTELTTTWAGRPVRRSWDAQGVAREVALAAQRALGMRPTAVLLEFTCGACNALDEYTAFLTPGQLAEVYDSLKGQFVGVGLELSVEDLKLTISQVIPGSPADLASLKPGDRVTRINGRATTDLSAESATGLLRGEAGSTVELEVAAGGSPEPRKLKLTRQPVSVPSVSEPRFLGDRMLSIGYLQLVGFQETTLQELDEAILKLQAAGMRVLILDLRGNPGGLVDVAVQVVQRFLPEGLITSTQGQIRAYNRVYEAHNMSALAVPLVVLIDGETASSAEMVAGALKENQRGRLVGQRTFGKGSIQHYWRLSNGAGLRITVAKFYSPHGHPYSEAGVAPQLAVERALVPMSMDLEQDPQIRAALETAQHLVMGR